MGVDVGIKRERDLDNEVRNLTQDNKSLRRQLRKLKKLADRANVNYEDDSFEVEDDIFKPEEAPVVDTPKSEYRSFKSYKTDRHSKKYKTRYERDDKTFSDKAEVPMANRCKCGGELKQVAITPDRVFKICQRCQAREKVN